MEFDRLVVGRIVKPHGIRGEVSVEILSDAPDRFAKGRTLLMDDDTVTIETSRPHQGKMLVKFEEVPDRNGAELLRGVELTIPAEDAAPLPEGSYYAHQLAGCAVVAEDGAPLGTLLRVDESPASDLWVVDHDGLEVLVPAVKQIVLSVDLAERTIVLSPPEGLFP